MYRRKLNQQFETLVLDQLIYLRNCAQTSLDDAAEKQRRLVCQRTIMILNEAISAQASLVSSHM